MQVHGKCHCGEIEYEAKVDPQKVVICHCTDCQILTGCAYRISVPTTVSDYKLISGKVKSYIKTADSGNRRSQTFCQTCATPIYAEDTDNPTTRTLRIGCIEERAELIPKKQIWCKSALPWAEDISGIEPKVDGQ